MIRYNCSKCGAEMDSPSSLAGQEDKCPACGKACVVPEGKSRRRMVVTICAGGAVLALAVVTVTLLWPGRERPGSTSSETEGKRERPGSTSSETEGKKVTLGELRNRPPICGTYKRGSKRFVDNIGAIQGRHLSEWSGEISRFGYNRDAVEFLLAIPSAIPVLFAGDKYDEQGHKRLVARLKTVPKEEESKWKIALAHALPNRSRLPRDYYIPFMLSAMDALYDGAGKYDPKRAARYLRRLRSLSDKHIDLFLEKTKFGGHQYDAVVSITLVDDFFKNDRFDEKRFNEVMNEE